MILGSIKLPTKLCSGWQKLRFHRPLNSHVKNLMLFGRLLFMGAAILLSACATPYVQNSFWAGTGGYSEKKIDDGKYYIESLVNVPTGPIKALEYWHRRAAELCQGKPYTHDVVVTTQRKINYGGVPGYHTTHDWPLAIGTATCKQSDS